MLAVMQFVRDLDLMVLARLAEHGYARQQGDTTNSRFALLMSHTERLIPERKYAVHTSRELDERQLPPDNARALAEIVHRLQNGLSLKPYLSKRVERPETGDGLLLSWGLLHLHLNPISTAASNGFVTRSDTLLMLRLEENRAYLVDIQPHSDPDWTVNTRLLEIINSNWPELLREISGVTPHQHTSQEMKALRSIHMNFVVGVGGRAISTNIVSSGGISMAAQLQYDSLCIELENVERDVRQRFYMYFPHSLRTVSPWIQHIELTSIEDEFFTLVNQTTQHRCLARRTTYQN